MLAEAQVACAMLHVQVPLPLEEVEPGMQSRHEAVLPVILAAAAEKPPTSEYVPAAHGPPQALVP